MLNFSNQIQASRGNGQGYQAGPQANFGGQGQQQSKFDKYSPSKGYDHELDQILKSSNSGAKTKVRMNDFSMSQFGGVSNNQSPQGKRDGPVNVSIMDSVNQLELLLNNTQDNRNRSNLYKPAFRNIEIEKPSYGNSVSPSPFMSPGASGIDQNPGNQVAPGFSNMNATSNSQGYNDLYFASQNPVAGNGFNANQGSFGKKNDVSAFDRVDNQGGFGNQAQPIRNLNMASNGFNQDNKSNMGAFGTPRNNADPFGNNGNQTYEPVFSTQASRTVAHQSPTRPINDIGMRDSPDISQKMWPVNNADGREPQFGGNLNSKPGSTGVYQVFSEPVISEMQYFGNTDKSQPSKSKINGQPPFNSDNMSPGQGFGALDKSGRSGTPQKNSVNEPFSGIEPRFINSDQKGTTQFNSSDFNNGQRIQQQPVQSIVIGGANFGGQNAPQGQQGATNTNNGFQLQPTTVMSSTMSAAMPESGRHTRTFPNGSVYSGDFKDHKRHGKGRQQWADGSVYEGQWESDQIQGEGRLIHGNGDEYTGSFVKNAAQGKGKYVRNEGGEYIGDWQADRQHGNGVEISPDGDRYQGSFKAGKKDGRGFYEWSNGCKYEGDWSNNRINGEGKFAWPDGRMYKGQFLNNKLHGSGTFYWPDGSQYAGQYNCDKRHGSGIMTFSDKKAFRGNWNMGQMHGEGEVALPDGKIKRGRWHNGRRIEWIS